MYSGERLNMFGIFKKIEKLNKKIGQSFQKVDTDIKHLQDWVHHLRSRNEYLENSHSSHMEMTRKDMNTLSKWLHYLYTHNVELHKRINEVSSYLMEADKRNRDLSERISELEDKFQGQVRTSQGTSQGQVEDMSSEEKGQQEEINNTTKKDLVEGKSYFTGSQLEFMKVLYDADRPLSYSELAHILGKKDKSVRNLIYELREKGIKIKSRFVGLRKKGFYLPKEEKIKITGR